MHHYPSSEINPGVITAADINRTLEGLRGDMATVLQRMAVSDALAIQYNRTDTDHETRLRRLESFRWILVGIALTISSASGILTGLILR